MSAIAVTGYPELSTDQTLCGVLVNRARSAHGLRGLLFSKRLSYRAQNHSKAMADKGSIFHTTAEHMYEWYGGRFDWKALGENVGAGPSVEAVHKAFMASEHHRANILGHWSYIGTGVVHRSGIAYVTQAFFL